MDADLVVMDPPRAGMGAATLKLLVALRPGTCATFLAALPLWRAIWLSCSSMVTVSTVWKCSIASPTHTI